MALAAINTCTHARMHTHTTVYQHYPGLPLVSNQFILNKVFLAAISN